MIIPLHKQPTPKKGTQVRIEGPWTIKGMRVWRVYDVSQMPWKPIGPYCFSWDEARTRADDAVKGKPVAWFGNTKLVPTPFY